MKTGRLLVLLIGVGALLLAGQRAVAARPVDQAPVPTSTRSAPPRLPTVTSKPAHVTNPSAATPTAALPVVLPVSGAADGFGAVDVLAAGEILLGLGLLIWVRRARARPSE